MTQIDASWNVWLREPVRLPVQGALSVQLPPGSYTLFQRTSTEFELIPWHAAVTLGLRELEDLRGSGKLVIQSEWPGASHGCNLRREEVPVEVELSAEDLFALSNKPTPDPAQSPGELRAEVPVTPQAQTAWLHPVTAARKLQLPAARVALALSVAVAALLTGAVVYLPSSPERPVDEAMAAVPRTAPPEARPPATPVSERLPVRVANPFDGTEVFEFPPGMSETEARDTVADLLIKRARDRQLQRSKSTRLARGSPS